MFGSSRVAYERCVPARRHPQNTRFRALDPAGIAVGRFERGKEGAVYIGGGVLVLILVVLLLIWLL